ncbi:MAG: Alpha-acetolactate decarboxylase [Candidatus Celerinatantimonas neptuna]|nr:MAG: Alpha-acetolactate decarboxylase [Candidatus Celerinatantimonas neptuna]
MNTSISQFKTCSSNVVRDLRRYRQNTSEGEIYQTSLMSALIAGVYEGTATIDDLLHHGDFGLGTFNQLDGELIAFDGQIFQLKSDGSANRATDEQCTPFAVMTHFKPDVQIPLKGVLTRQQLHALIDDLVPSDNVFCAIRIDGHFKGVNTRTVPRQTRPYTPMIDAIKEQPTFEFNDTKGLIVGYRSPQYTLGINVAGYHEHFITQDRLGGGHVQDYEILSGSLKIAQVSRLVIDMPETSDFLAAQLVSKDMQADIETAEK